MAQGVFKNMEQFGDFTAFYHCILIMAWKLLVMLIIFALRKKYDSFTRAKLLLLLSHQTEGGYGRILEKKGFLTNLIFVQKSTLSR